jgi:hypothetical protein
MKTLSLRDRLMRYMMKNHDVWVASGDLQRIVVQETDYTPRTAVRRLEELAEEGKLQVEYRKGHAFYKVNATTVIDRKGDLAAAAEAVRIFDMTV